MSWIRTANIMAPAVYMKCSRSEVLRLLSVDSTDAWLAARALNQAAVLEVLPHNRAIVAFGDLFCSAQTPITQNICYLVIELVGGSNPKQRDTARLNDYMANFPGGGSLKQLAHYGQLMHTHCEEFRQFDYGLLNFGRYGAASPPKYNVRPAGECNLTIIYGLNDLLAVKSSIDKIHCQIPNSTIVVVSDPEWTHFDFIIGLGIKEYVNDG
ncbi:hypothetical protein ONE63_003347 [Megalurothrips usitatus]|uniref:Uncharacterized protein n=1 Tax=Megalurothrips usitatus TaxID=439358 RepID=A0AAV7XAQ5_9NEOP|nr:hypothetical protein ONE63_003347 [Megalurothrips usitatus]